MKMFSRKEDERGHSAPAIVTLIVALVGTTGILLGDLGPGNDSHGSGDARMITAAAVSKAGAIELPSEPASLG